MAAPKDDPDKIYAYSAAAHNALCQQKPWTTDPKYFKNVKISANALIKMVMHARSGGDIEVMGMLQGKIEANTFIVTDTFPLPVEASETRVNAGATAMEFMIGYLELVKKAGREENPVGWYHSHPGYGCWLSGIDVSTQMLQQQWQEPWLAIVVDPKRTINSGKVQLGAFRTYPKDYKPPDEGTSEYQTIPLEKIEDFGVHVKSYYQLDVSYFKSTLDNHLLELLWNKYWVSTLSSSPILANKEYTTKQLSDLTDKLEQSESQLQHSRMGGGFFMGGGGGGGERKKEESALAKISKDSIRPSAEQVHGLMSQVLKDILFNQATRPKGI